MKPLLLDLFCKAGGAAMGYYRAGFDVIGVDIEAQPRFPFWFYQGDALEFVAKHGHEFDAIHASPPCQGYSHMTPARSKDNHPRMIETVRELLRATGKPYIIENVAGARRELNAPFMICGAQLGLKVYRHRFFESNLMMFGTPHFPHRDNTPRAGHGISDKGFLSVGAAVKGLTPELMDAALQYASSKGFISVVGNHGGTNYARYAMGIEWMTGRELAEAIPPAYTEYIGKQLKMCMAV